MDEHDGLKSLVASFAGRNIVTSLVLFFLLFMYFSAFVRLELIQIK